MLLALVVQAKSINIAAVEFKLRIKNYLGIPKKLVGIAITAMNLITRDK